MKEYDKVIQYLEKGAIYLLTVISGKNSGEKLIIQGGEKFYPNEELKHFWDKVYSKVSLDECPCRYKIDACEIFAERVVHEPELVICGGGHISLEIAALADYLGYPYTVIDEREEFANRERFNTARECICQPFTELFRERSFSSNAYYIIVTRGHSYDLQCLEQILKCPNGYIGMIGSRGKVKKTMDVLTEQGFSSEELKRVHAPIGLDIGGQTPREIGISIAAELIKVKNTQAPASYLEPEMRKLLAENPKMVHAKIIDKRGSAPRGTGSQMLVDASGIVCGTIGGGKIEYEAAERAKKLATTGGSMIESYCLDTSSAASLGMWCGGEVDVFFEA